LLLLKLALASQEIPALIEKGIFPPLPEQYFLLLNFASVIQASEKI